MEKKRKKEQHYLELRIFAMNNMCCYHKTIFFSFPIRKATPLPSFFLLFFENENEAAVVRMCIKRDICMIENAFTQRIQLNLNLLDISFSPSFTSEMGLFHILCMFVVDVLVYMRRKTFMILKETHT
ncbi:CLUMA_CG005184, isoform A [Clunio marinus]|uniref:CLUMA_CG005184, isoform A n=1 Tax=Clunio marinus TaxID=568069 RepID=A0A1J1HU45_9DIPT|nr:CLUMA_CG005184, isoform A [Clunio marinus]